jgi:hypothetical protein
MAKFRVDGKMTEGTHLFETSNLKGVLLGYCRLKFVSIRILSNNENLFGNPLPHPRCLPEILLPWRSGCLWSS